MSQYTQEQVEQYKRGELWQECNKRFKDIQGPGNPWLSASNDEMRIALLLPDGEIPERLKQVTPAPVATTPVAGDAAAHLALAMQSLMAGNQPAIDEKQIRQIIQDELEKTQAGQVKRLEIKMPNQPQPVDAGKQHNIFPVLFKHIAARDHVYLVGPAGTGKTQVTENIAGILQLPFGSKSCGPTTTEMDFTGYQDANGNYHTTEFRKCFESGGVFCCDEIDAASGEVLVMLNASLSNGYMAFPDGMIRKHKDFVFIACANTYGTGATKDYTGRGEIDRATLSRFSQIEMDYDTALERSIAQERCPAEFSKVANTWVDLVHHIRTLDPQGVLTPCPRSVMSGAWLLCWDLEPEHVMQARIFRGAPETAVKRVQDDSQVKSFIKALKLEIKAAQKQQALNQTPKEPAPVAPQPEPTPEVATSEEMEFAL